MTIIDLHHASAAPVPAHHLRHITRTLSDLLITPDYLVVNIGHAVQNRGVQGGVTLHRIGALPAGSGLDYSHEIVLPRILVQSVAYRLLKISHDRSTALGYRDALADPARTQDLPALRARLTVAGVSVREGGAVLDHGAVPNHETDTVTDGRPVDMIELHAADRSLLGVIAVQAE